MPKTGDLASENWLSLADAARHLGIHYTTLRRWADAGDIPCVRTPGGWRRFSRSDLDAFIERTRGQPTNSLSMPLELATNVTANVLEHVHSPEFREQSWMIAIQEEQRVHFQHRGRQLLGMLVQYTSRRQPEPALLEGAIALGKEHGRLCCTIGLSTAQTVEAFLAFRRALVGSIEYAGLSFAPHDVEGQRIQARMSDFLDHLLVATVEGHSEAD